MAIDNLLLNINYKNTCGQSSVLQHLLTYSHKLGVFPQHLDNISTRVHCLWRNDKPVFSLVDLHDGFHLLASQDDYLDRLKRILVANCKDIERKPILESNFNFCLPSSVSPGNLIEKHPEQCMYFASQTGPLYIYDYNKRFKRENVVIVAETKLFELNERYKLNAKTFNELLAQLSEKISSRTPDRAANFIKDKPIALLNIALEHGLEYTLEEGLSLFIKDFTTTHDSSTNYGIGELPITIIDVNELTSNTTNGTDYYKYMCDSLNVSINTELYNLFENTFIKASTEDRLNIITGSKFLKSILCNEPYKD